MYSLSSCWNSHRHTDGRAMLREIRDLGFEAAELSHGVRLSLLPGIIQAVEAGEIQISSVHNFCPLPMGVEHANPNLYKFTSDQPRERENALRHTLRTLETAARVKAPFVVLHLGCVEMKDYTEKLVNLLAAQKSNTTKYEKLVEEVTYRREEIKERPLQHAYEILHRLSQEAERLGLKLGIENREAVEEVPFESDFSLFFKEFRSPAIGYWHDTGHAQIKENLGFIYHLMHLESLQDRLLGFHLHDVQYPARDHQAPGSGMIDWAALRPMVKPEHVKVFEFSPHLPEDELRAGVAHLKKLWGDG
jgi:sugar phosphate isomerase/epimerase